MAIGFLLLIPSAMGLLLSLLILAGALAEETTVLGIVVGSSLAILVGIASLVGGLIGWLLVMTKRVLQCQACGAIVDAAMTSRQLNAAKLRLAGSGLLFLILLFALRHPKAPLPEPLTA